MFSAIAIGIITIYRFAISPMLPHSCRFAPTCSAYAIDAIRNQGICAGLWLTLGRVLRCNPWNPGGSDPAPLPRKGSRLCH